jgi:alkaline phosphatase D
MNSRLLPALTLAACTAAAQVAPPAPAGSALSRLVASAREEALGPVPSAAPVPGPAWLHAGPMVGDVTPQSAKLWLKTSNAAATGIRVSLREDLSDARTVNGPATVEAADFTATITLDGLAPGTRYYYTPLIDGREALVRPLPSFVTPLAEGSAGKHRIALGSCVGRRGHHAAAAFGEMAARRHCDVLLMLGDNHYADTTDPAKLRDYYHMQRTVDGFASVIRHTPTYAIWDDHDYGPNNSDGTEDGKATSLRVFSQWWANPAAGEPENPGCYYRFVRGDLEFFMLDDRYYRTPNKAKDDGHKTMLGTRQLQWLKDGLSASTAKFKIIAAGSEWQTRTQADGWASFARDRQEIFDHVRSMENVVFVSGDRHFTAGYQIQGRFVEFTSGPIGSNNATLLENPERFTGMDEGKLWVVLETDTTVSPPRFAWEIWQAGGGLLERRDLTPDELNGRAVIAPSPPLLPRRMEKKPGR